MALTKSLPPTAISNVARLLSRLGPTPSGDGPTWLAQTRQEALEWATRRGLPTRKDEDWRYTPLDRFLEVPFERAEAGPVPRAVVRSIDSMVVDASSARLVFINGHFAPALSSLGDVLVGVTVTNTASVLREGGTYLEAIFTRAFDDNDHALTALNAAFAEDGAYIHVAPDTVLSKPIELMFISDAQHAPLISTPRSVILAGARSRFSVIETHAGSTGEVTCTNAVLHVALDEEAHVEHYKIQNEPDTAFHFALLDVRQGPNSQFSSGSLAVGSKSARNEVHVRLEGEGALVNLDGLYLPRGDQNHDNAVLVEHAAPRCMSRQLYKGIVDGQGHGIFNGHIVVLPGASGTDAGQTNKNLLLSDHAEVDTRPRLEIFTDDVKCAHGAAVGALDEDALFYLRSRGVPLEAARTLLTHAFAREMLDRIEPASLRSHVATLLADRFLVDGNAAVGVLP